MPKIIKWLLIVSGFFLVLITILVLTVIYSENGKIRLPVEHKKTFVLDDSKRYPLELLVEGNRILDANGKQIIFKGLMPADPARLHNLNRFNKRFFEKMKKAGANIIRIPIHPENWVNDKDYLWRYLDPIVDWVGELDMYVIIDWHYIGNISTGKGENMPDIDVHPKELTSAFWKRVAAYFIDVPHVLFEIFNEPADITPTEWLKNANEIVKIIRNQGAEQLIIVGGTDYGKNISWVANNQVEDKNIIYASHIYPAHLKSSWSYYFGDTSSKYPVLITEWGFIDENREKTQEYLVGDVDNYGQPFINYLKERDIGWIACWYDNKWEPQMFRRDFKQLTDYGEFIINNLAE